MQQTSDAAMSLKDSNNAKKKGEIASAASFVTECLAGEDAEDTPANEAGEVVYEYMRGHVH
jgi:hypothetical protein